MYTVLICGAGQLGRRYLEGILKSDLSLNIYIFDIKEKAIVDTKSFLGSLSDGSSSQPVNFISQLDMLPSTIDLCIVSTTANSRAQIIDTMQSYCIVKNWILEKVLAQSSLQVNQITRILPPQSKCLGQYSNANYAMVPVP